MYQSEWLDIILIAGFGQGIFLWMMLWRKAPTNRQAVSYLMAAVGLVALLLLGRATFHPSFVKRFAEIIMLPDVILFLIGPLLYFFILSILRQPLPDKPQRWLHYLPSFLHVSVVNTILGLHIKGVWGFLPAESIWVAYFCIEAAGIISFTAYTYASYRAFQKYRNAYHEKYAAPFLGRFLTPFFILSFIVAASWLIGFIYSYTLADYSFLFYIIVWFVLCIIIYFIAYQTLLHPELLKLPSLKADRAPVSPGVSEEAVEQLRLFMSAQKPYLEQEIKLGSLAKEMNMPRHELSRVINHGFGKNFFDFINEYRVQEFIRLRKEQKNNHLNTLELAFQSGFNSKSAFNRAFRKKTGKSPRSFFAEEKV